MGLFDIPAPLLTALDDGLSLLPPLARLLLWAIITAAISMLCYWAFSAQEKIGAAKQAALDARAALNNYEGHEFAEMWPLLGNSLRTSGRHFLVVLGPALLGSLPALLVIVWVSNQFGYHLPVSGDTLTVTTTPAVDLRLDTKGDNFVIDYPAAGGTRKIATDDGIALTALPLSGAVPVIHKKLWWNTLIGNRAGYLADDAPVDELRIDLTAQRFHKLGPGWAQTWEVPYFLMLILASLTIKFVFRID